MIDEIYQGIKALEKKRVKSVKVKVAPHREIQNLLDEAERLRETIATLEPGLETLGEMRNRLQMLSQQVTNREEKLKEVNQSHQALVKRLKKEIEEKSLRNAELEKEIEILRSEYEQRVQRLEEQVVQRDCEVRNLRDEALCLRQMVTALEAASQTFDQISFDLKGQLKESRSRLEVLSRELTTGDKKDEKVQSRNGEEPSSSIQKEVQVLWATYKQKLKTISPHPRKNLTPASELS